jgi:hypothetical protein
MSWTEEQWDAFCAMLQGGFPGDFTDEERSTWRIFFDEVDPQLAVAGLKRVVFAGTFKFRPSVSELMGAIRNDPSVPTFDEAYPTIYSAAAAQQIPQTHPLIAGFIEWQGLSRLGQLPLDDPDWGEKTRRDLEAAWDRHVEACDGREVMALASNGEPRRLDPLASLQLGPPS